MNKDFYLDFGYMERSMTGDLDHRSRLCKNVLCLKWYYLKICFMFCPILLCDKYEL